MVDFPPKKYFLNFWLDRPTKVRSTELRYILKDLFRKTPLAYRWDLTEERPGHEYTIKA